MAATIQQIYDQQAAILDMINGGALGRAQAGYAAMAANLRGTVRSLMIYTINVDPAATSHTNDDGGTAATLVEAIASIPAGASATIGLKAGSTHTLSADVVTHAGGLNIVATGDGAAPIINWQMGVVDGLNQMRRFICYFSSTIRLTGIECRIPTALANAGLGVASFGRTMFDTWPAAPIQMSFDGCKIIGGTAATRLGIIDCGGGTTGIVGLTATTLDGPFSAVVNNTGGLAMISRSALTLANGATLSEGGTLGTHYFAN